MDVGTAATPQVSGLKSSTRLGRNAPTEISTRGQSQGLNRAGNTFRSTSSVKPGMRSGMRSSTATPGSRFLSPTNARVSSPGSTQLAAPGGPKLPATTSSPSTGSGASKLPATRGGTVAATQGAPKAASSGFTYTRLGDTPLKAAANKTIANRVASIAAKAAPKIAGKALGIAGLAVPDSTKTEPGNPVFRKTDTGKTQVAGYRSSTTPRMGDSDKNTQTGMVGNMSRRSGMAPSVRNQELPSKIAPVQTKEPGTLSAPKPAATPKAEPSSFKQAFAQARKEAGTMGAKSTGQFEYKGGKYQTNIQGKGTAKAPEEKFVPMSQQKVTSVGKASAAPSTSTTPGSMKVSAQPAPSSASTAGMSSAAEKSGVPQTPAPSMKNDFAAGKDVSSTPVPTTSTAPAATPAPEVKASVSTAPEPAPAKAPEPEKTYSADSPAGKAWANRGKFGTQQENKMVAESFVTVGDNKYRIV